MHSVTIIIIIIIKRISRAPIYRTRWEHRALYNNTDNTHRTQEQAPVASGNEQSVQILTQRWWPHHLPLREEPQYAN